MENHSQSSRDAPIASDDHSSSYILEPTTTSIQTAVRDALDVNGDLTCWRLRNGADHTVYAIGDNYVARCYPSTEKKLASLTRDAAVQKLVGDYVRNTKTIPQVVKRVAVSEWEGNVERKVHGTPLHEAEPTEKTEDDLGALLRSLSSVPFDEAVKATGYQQERVNLKARVSKAVRDWDELVLKSYAVDPDRKMLRLLREKLHQLGNFPSETYKPVLVHGDINSENILINRQDGSIAGVIDWTEAIVGDVCIDVAGIVFAAGATMARRIGKKASLSDNEVERGLLYAMTAKVRDLRWYWLGSGGYHRDRLQYLERLFKIEFVRIFEGTGLESSLRAW